MEPSYTEFGHPIHEKWLVEVRKIRLLVSPWAAAVPAAAEMRSPKVKMLRSQGILLVSGVIPDLDKVFDHQLKGCKLSFERCE